MDVVKESADYKVFKKKSGRFAVKNKDGKWVNGADKAAILSKEGLIKLSAPKKKEEPPAEEEAAPAATEDAPATDA